MAARLLVVGHSRQPAARKHNVLLHPSLPPAQVYICATHALPLQDAALAPAVEVPAPLAHGQTLHRRPPRPRLLPACAPHAAAPPACRPLCACRSLLCLQTTVKQCTVASLFTPRGLHFPPFSRQPGAATQSAVVPNIQFMHFHQPQSGNAALSSRCLVRLHFKTSMVGTAAPLPRCARCVWR